MTTTTLPRTPHRPRLLLVSLLAIAPAAVSPAQPETVQSIVAHVRDATGQSNLAKHEAGVLVTGRATLAGVDDTFSFVFDSEGHFAQSYDGPLPLHSGFDGTRAWTDDLAGERRILALGEREQAIIGGAIMTGQWLTPGSPLTLSLAASPDKDPGIATLGFALTGGEISGQVRIDRSTWLPTRWTWFVAGQSFDLALSGAVSLNGVHFPASIVRTGSTGMEIRVTVEKIADAPQYFRSPYEPITTPPTDIKFDAAADPAVTVKKAPTGHLLVHPLVAGKDVGWFIFDSGAGINVLSNESAETLGVQTFGHIPAIGVGGTTMNPLARPDSLTLGPATIDKPLMMVMDLNFLNPTMGRRIAGIVGYGLLHRTVAEIDMEKPSISLFDPAAYDASHPGRNWCTLVVDGRVPCVEASFEGHKGFFRLDTGAGATTVSFHIPAVERLHLLDDRETEPSAEGGVGGLIPSRRGKLEWFEIGGRRIQNVRASFSVRPKRDDDEDAPPSGHGAGGGAFATPYTLGNIGGALVRPFVLVMDYQHGRIAYVERAAVPPAEKP